MFLHMNDVGKTWYIYNKKKKKDKRVEQGETRESNGRNGVKKDRYNNDKKFTVYVNMLTCMIKDESNIVD